MLWVSKGNISAVYRQSACVFMLVITICVEFYLWFAPLVSSFLALLVTTFLWWYVFELPVIMPSGEDT